MSEAAESDRNTQSVHDKVELIGSSEKAFNDSLTRISSQLPELFDLDDYLSTVEELRKNNASDERLQELKQIVVIKKNQMQNIINRNGKDLIFILNNKLVREQKTKDLTEEIRKDKADLWVEETRQKKHSRIDELRNQIQAAEEMFRVNNEELKQLTDVLEKFESFRIRYNDDLVMPWERTENNEIKRDPKYNPHTCPFCNSMDTIIQDQIKDRLTLKCQECQKVWKL